jgi:hypothetical protein
MGKICTDVAELFRTMTTYMKDELGAEDGVKRGLINRRDSTASIS